MVEEKIKVSIDDDFIKLDVKGDISTSYPLFGDNPDEHIDSFMDDLRKAIKGERISTLG